MATISKTVFKMLRFDAGPGDVFNAGGFSMTGLPKNDQL
jgi:hypothetical protein